MSSGRRLTFPRPELGTKGDFRLLTNPAIWPLTSIIVNGYTGSIAKKIHRIAGRAYPDIGKSKSEKIMAESPQHRFVRHPHNRFGDNGFFIRLETKYGVAMLSFGWIVVGMGEINRPDHGDKSCYANKQSHCH